MPIQISPKRQVKGLYSNPNHSSGIPEGGLLEADNCTVDRPGLLSKRKGFNRYGSELSADVRSLLDYDGSLVVHYGTNMGCDASDNGTLTPWGSVYKAPDKRNSIRGVSLKKNFYFTSADGIFGNDSPSNTPRLAGMPEGLDIETSVYGTGAGWFTHDSQVGYRVVWSREDANKSVIIGEPSYRHAIANRPAAVTMSHDGGGYVIVAHHGHGFTSGDVVTISQSSVSGYEGSGKTIIVIDENSYKFSFSTDLGSSDARSGKDHYVKLVFTVPDGVIAGDKYEIYRTAISASKITDPGDEHMSVIKKEITADELTAGTVEFSDTTLEISLGEFLYTNAGQETISQRNTRPPLAKDMTEFRGHMFLSDLTYKSEKEIHLNGVSDIVVGDSISVKVGVSTLTYKFAAVESFGDREFKLTTTEETDQQNIEETARSLVRAINRDTDNSLIYAHYASGIDDASGRVLIRVRRIGVAEFSVTASTAALGASFKDDLPTSGETFKSEANTVVNGLAYSKVMEPDAVPGANIFNVGSANEPIQRIFGLRNSLIILKKDGVYRLSGNSPATFVLETLDPAVRFAAPNAAASLNDSVYCLSTQGILRVGDNGTNVISYAIEDQIRNIPSFLGYDETAFAVANEENRRLIVFTPKNSGDRWAKVGWVYNFLTKEWTTWSKDVSCGVSLLGKRDLYLGHKLDKYVLKERNGVSARNSGDYCDEDIPVTVTATDEEGTDPDGTTSITFTYDYREPIRAGFLFTQGGASTKIKTITSVSGTTVVAVLESVTRAGITTDPSAATVSLPIDSIVKWAPNGLGVSELPKQFTYATITMESGTALTNELGFYSDGVLAEEWVGAITLNTPLGWGSGAWGTSKWGNEDTTVVVPLTSPVPRQHQRCRELTVMFRHRVANEEFNIESIALRYRLYKGKLVRTPE